MIRVLASAILLAFLLPAPPVRAQIDTSLSDRQIIANILKECREEYMRTIGPCACADNRTRGEAPCVHALKDVRDGFKPFCTRKDVTLNEVRLYRMQNEGFIDRRCSK